MKNNFNYLTLALVFAFFKLSAQSSPGGVPGSILWLKADAGTNTTTDGVGITSWTDQSGNGYDATGTGDAVYSFDSSNAFNGNPVILFTGDPLPITGDNIVRGNLTNSSTDESTIFVVQRKDTGADESFVEFFDGSARQYLLERRYIANAPYFSIPNGVQGILTVSDPGGVTGNAAPANGESKIFFNSNKFFDSNNIFSSSWTTGDYVIGDDSTGGNEFNGEIGEIIYYDYKLSEFNQKKVESYLATKYGITLDDTTSGVGFDNLNNGDYINSIGTVVWDASVDSGNYQNDVIGIAKDNGTSLDQPKSSEFNDNPDLAILSIESNSLDDLDMLYTGHNNGTLAFNATGVPSGITTKSGRTWRVETSGTPGSIDVSFQLSTGFDNTGNASEYALLISDDEDFTSGTTIVTGNAIIIGNRLEFNGVNFSDGQYFTLALTPVTEFPAGVSDNISHWFRADLGTNTNVSGEAITDWNDQTSNSNHATKTGTNAVTYQEDIHNYNPAILFANGDDGHLNIANDLDQLAGTNYSVLAVVERTATSETNSYFLGVESTTNNEGFRMGYQNDTRVELHHDGAGSTGTDSNPDQRVRFNVNSFVDSSTEQPALFKAIHTQGVSRTLNYTSANESEEFLGNAVNTNNLIASSQLASIGRWRTTRGFQGYVSEIIIYTDDLDVTEQLKIESYLAVKYGLTLKNGSAAENYIDSNGDNIWNATTNLAYHNEIIGIGRDDISALNQLKSSEQISSTALTVEKPSNFDNDKDYVIIGNDSGTIGVTTTGKSPVYAERIERTWKAQVSGDVQGLTISITLPVTSTGNATDYALLIDSDTNFSDSNIVTTGASLNGDTITFTDVDLSDGDVFTVGIGLSVGPANVTNGLTHWFRADDISGVSANGETINTWNNQTGSNDASNSTSTGDATYATNQHNFNPSVSFPTGDDGYFTVDLDAIKGSDYGIIAVTERNNTGNTNYIVGTATAAVGQGLHVGYRTNTVATQDHYGGGNGLDIDPIAGYDATTSTSSLITARLNTTTGKLLTYLEKGAESSVTDSNVSTLSSGVTADGVIGYGFGAGTGFGGNISEVIIYNNAITGVNDLKKIHSYLAIKYGFTLDNTGGGENGDYLDSNANVIWDASENTTYHYDVAGIGADVASNLLQKQSKSENSDDILTISISSTIATTNQENPGSFEDNLDYLIWGNDNSASSALALISHSSSISNCFNQINRNWKISNSGNVDNLTLEFDTAALSSKNLSLLIDLDGDGDYTTGSLEDIDTGILTGNNLKFENVSLPHNSVFTLVDNSFDIVYQIGAWTGGNGTNDEFDNSATDLAKTVNILEDVTLTGSHNCKCLRVSNGAVLTIQDDNYLTVSNTLESNGSIYLKGNSELIQSGTNTNSGIGKVFKVIDEGTDSAYRYNYFSSPVNTLGVFSIEDNLKFNTGVTLGDNTDPTYTREFEGTGAAISTRWTHKLNGSSFIEINGSTTMVPGEGFTMKGTGAVNKYNFIGSANNGEINVPITTGNFLLTGNPYPSTINIDTFNANMLAGNITDGAIYLWEQPTGDAHSIVNEDDLGGYATIINGIKTSAASTSGNGPNSGTTTPTEFIKPGQGFVVYGGSTGGDVQFTNALRGGITFNGDRHFFKTNKLKSLRQIIRLGFEYEKEDGKTFHRQIATALEGGTMEREIGKDAFMFDYYANDAFWVIPSDEDRYAITSAPFASDDLELPIGVVVENTKEVTFKLDATENYNGDVYLYDNETKQITNIKENSYKVNLLNGEYRDRFSLVFNNQETLSNDFVNENTKTLIRIIDGKIAINLEDKTIREVGVYSLTGESVLKHTPINISSYLEFDSHILKSQPYIIKIITNNGIITKKKLIK